MMRVERFQPRLMHDLVDRTEDHHVSIKEIILGHYSVHR